MARCMDLGPRRAGESQYPMAYPPRRGSPAPEREPFSWFTRIPCMPPKRLEKSFLSTWILLPLAVSAWRVLSGMRGSNVSVISAPGL